MAEAGVNAPILHHRLERWGRLSIDTARGTAHRHRALRPCLRPRRRHARRPVPRAGRDHHRSISAGRAAILALNQGEEPEYATSTRVGGLSPRRAGGERAGDRRRGRLGALGGPPGGCSRSARRARAPTPGRCATVGAASVRPSPTAISSSGSSTPSTSSAGRMRLDRDAAREAMDAVADRLGYEGGDRAVRAADAAPARRRPR